MPENRIDVLINVISEGENELERINKKLIANQRDINHLSKTKFLYSSKADKKMYGNSIKLLKLENAELLLDKKQATIEQKASSKELKNMKNKLNLQKKLDNATKKGSMDWYKTLLPVLFVSQQISQGLKSVLQPANDLLGTQEVLNDFLAAAFIPTAEKNLNTVLMWGDGLLNLSEGTRETIGDTIQYGQVMAAGVTSTVEAALSAKGLSSAQAAVATGIMTSAATIGVMSDNLIGLAAIMGNTNALLLAGSVKYGEALDETKKKTEELCTATGGISDKAIEVGSALASAALLNDYSSLPNAVISLWNSAITAIETYKYIADGTYAGGQCIDKTRMPKTAPNLSYFTQNPFPYQQSYDSSVGKATTVNYNVVVNANNSPNIDKRLVTSWVDDAVRAGSNKFGLVH